LLHRFRFQCRPSWHDSRALSRGDTDGRIAAPAYGDDYDLDRIGVYPIDNPCAACTNTPVPGKPPCRRLAQFVGFALLDAPGDDTKSGLSPVGQSALFGACCMGDEPSAMRDL